MNDSPQKSIHQSPAFFEMLKDDLVSLVEIFACYENADEPENSSSVLVVDYDALAKTPEFACRWQECDTWKRTCEFTHSDEDAYDLFIQLFSSLSPVKSAHSLLYIEPYRTHFLRPLFSNRERSLTDLQFLPQRFTSNVCARAHVENFTVNTKCNSDFTLAGKLYRPGRSVLDLLISEQVQNRVFAQYQSKTFSRVCPQSHHRRSTQCFG